MGNFQLQQGGALAAASFKQSLANAGRIGLVCVIASIFGIIAVTGVEIFGIRAVVVFPLGLVLLGCASFLLTRSDPLWLTGKILLVLLPVIGFILPPARFGISLFDVMGILATLALIIAYKNRQLTKQIQPSWWILLPIVLIFPTVLFSIDRPHSLYIYIEILLSLSMYIALLSVIDGTVESLEKATRLTAIAVIVVSGMIVFERLTKISLFSANLNLNVMVDARIYRAGGLFQDPQKAGQFLACFLAYFVVLLSRKAILKTETKAVLIVATVAAILGMVLTVSRMALLSGVVFAALGFILVNRFRIGYRLLMIVSVTICIALAFMMPKELSSFLPESVVHRLTGIPNDFLYRAQMWEESWNFFRANPLAGIGLGNYQEALMQERLSLRMLSQRGGYVPDQPENGYLKVLIEAGILGGAALVIFVSGLLHAVWKSRATEPERSYGIAALFSALVFAFTFLTLFTVSDDRNLMIIMLIASTLHSIQRRANRKVSPYAEQQR